MSSLKVLHISSEKTWRGGEQQIAYLIDELNQLEVENDVLCDESSEFERYCRDHSITHYLADFHGVFALMRTAIMLKELANKYDLVHVHTSKGHTVAFYSYLFGSKAKLIISRRVDFKPGRGFLTKFKYTFSTIRKFICVSDAIRNIMTTYLGSAWINKCLTVHSGVDLNKEDNSEKLNLRQQYDLGEEVKIVGNTSAIADHKDYFTFIDSADLLYQKNKNVAFFILGDGPLEEQVKEYAAIKDVSDRIFFTGFVSNPIAYLKNFNVFLITSKTEGLGTSIIDAFACKVPVVATEAGGIPELVIDMETGILCDVQNAEQLTVGVELLLSNEALRLQLVNNASKHLSNFTKEATAKKTLAVYKSIIS